MYLRPAIVAFLAAALAVPAAAPAKRADIKDVSKVVSGGPEDPYGPTNLPRPPQTADGRHYLYMNVVFVTAIRERRPARTYSFWPRLTLSEKSPPSVFYRSRAQVRDAMIMALTQIAQVDWPGETQFDATLASQLVRANVDAVLGGGKLDAVDFLHIDVQGF